MGGPDETFSTDMYRARKYVIDIPET